MTVKKLDILSLNLHVIMIKWYNGTVSFFTHLFDYYDWHSPIQRKLPQTAQVLLAN